ncbi:MAG: VWA domain-containing protein [Candidatus Eremiobacterota bacterium]
MKISFNIIAVILFLICLCDKGFCQYGQKILLTQNDTLTLNRIDLLAYPTIFLNVMVTDKEGNPVEGLGIKDFTVSENAIEQKIDSVISASQRNEPVTIMLTMDVSGSMGDEIYQEDGTKRRPLDDAKEGAKTFVSTLKAHDKVIVSVFADYWLAVNEVTEDRATVITSIDRLTPEGGTVLFQGVTESVKLLHDMEGNKAVIVLTDGKDTGKNLTLQECLTKITGQGVPVFTIGLGTNIDEKTLVNIARTTGGRYFRAPDSSKLKEIYELISKQLEKQYWIKYRVKKSHPIGSEVDVTVSNMSPAMRGVSNLKYITPAQLVNRIVEFGIGLVAIILLTVMIFHIFWKGCGFDPVISSYVSILISLCLATGLFVFLFLGVFIYYKMTLQVFFTLGILTVLGFIFIIWKIKDYA